MLPQTAEGPAQAVERRTALTRTSTGAMGPAIQDALPEQIMLMSEQTQEEGIDQGHQQEQLAPGFPLLQAWGLHAQLAFPVAETGLDLPPARIGQHHLPGRFLTLDGLVGHQIPRFTPPTGYHQPQR